VTVQDARRRAHLILAALFLLSLQNIGHLSWAEILRLALITGGLVWVFQRYRRSLDGASVGSFEKTAAAVLATVAAFVTTQFDPDTSVISKTTGEIRLSSSFLTGIVCSFGLLIVVVFSPLRDALRWRSWSKLDGIVIGVVVLAAILTMGAQQFVGSGLTVAKALATAKVLSLAGLWLGVTRTYGGGWQSYESRLKQLLLSRWTGALVAACVLFVPTLLYGTFRVGLVLHHFGEGREAYARKAYTVARDHYNIVSELNRTLALGFVRDRYLSDLAVLQFREGDAKGAREVMSRMKLFTSDKVEAEARSGDIYLRAGMRAEAQQTFERVLDAWGKHIESIDKLGGLYLQNRDTKRFLRLVERYDYVPQTEAVSFDDRIFLGDIFYFQSRFGDALTQYSEASDLRERDSYGVYKVGRALLAQGQYRSALRSFQDAVRLDSAFADAHFRMGQCLEGLGSVDEAWQSYQKTVTLLANHFDARMAVSRIEEQNRQ
jgi:tetratricopeptide (TPR) repeat protein